MGKTKKKSGGGGGVAFDPSTGIATTISEKKGFDITHNVVDWSFMT